jgi:hypothetical protein
MATPTTTQLARMHDTMMMAFGDYRASLSEAMDEVQAALDRKEYALACRQLSAISQTHARTSVNFRNVLTRNGFLAREGDDD